MANGVGGRHRRNGESFSSLVSSAVYRCLMARSFGGAGARSAAGLGSQRRQERERGNSLHECDASLEETPK